MLLFAFRKSHMEDSLRHKGMRKQLIKELISKGIKNQEVLNAINAIPRHIFMDQAFERFAYQDKAFPIAAGQTISQPYTVAFQTELLEVTKGDKVLEVGTGSGYQASVLCEMGVKVFTIERQKELFEKSRHFFEILKYRPQQKFGDGYKGLPIHGPYDGILVTCGAPFVPKALLTQLKVGGRLVIPVGEEEQIMTRITRVSEKEFSKKEYGAFKFVPFLKGKNY
jgi:protein-L-isoaspartate(D-aspartate) O-methyltransferase